jgi:hypothetical protein
MAAGSFRSLPPKRSLTRNVDRSEELKVTLWILYFLDDAHVASADGSSMVVDRGRQIEVFSP